MFVSIEDAIQELAKRYGKTAEKIIMLQASEVCFCCGVYADNEMKDGIVIMKDVDTEKWDICEGEKASTTAGLYIAFFGSLFDLVEERVESEQFGIDISGYFQ